MRNLPRKVVRNALYHYMEQDECVKLAKEAGISCVFEGEYEGFPTCDECVSKLCDWLYTEQGEIVGRNIVFVKENQPSMTREFNREYISKTVALNLFELMHGSDETDLATFEELLKSVKPMSDFAPNTHGKWETSLIPKIGYINTCSFCGHIIKTETLINYRFCPCCGSMMDEVVQK